MVTRAGEQGYKGSEGWTLEPRSEGNTGHGWGIQHKPRAWCGEGESIELKGCLQVLTTRSNLSFPVLH